MIFEIRSVQYSSFRYNKRPYMDEIREAYPCLRDFIMTEKGEYVYIHINNLEDLIKLDKGLTEDGKEWYNGIIVTADPKPSIVIYDDYIE